MRFKEIRDFYFEYRAFEEARGLDKETARANALKAYREKLKKYFGVRPGETMRTMTFEERFISHHPEMFGLADNAIFDVRMRAQNMTRDDKLKILKYFSDNKKELI